MNYISFRIVLNKLPDLVSFSEAFNQAIFQCVCQTFFEDYLPVVYKEKKYGNIK